MTIDERIREEINPLDSEIVHYSRQDCEYLVKSIKKIIREEIPKEKYPWKGNKDYKTDVLICKGHNQAIKQMKDNLK